jgi:hypothetical protein
MKAGDIVSLYSESFRLGVAIDSRHVLLIYSFNQVKYDMIELLLKNLKDLSTIPITLTEVPPKNKFEVYKTNIISTPMKLKKSPEDLFKFLIINLKKMIRFSVGDILKMAGPSILKNTLYNHFVVFSGICDFFIYYIWFLILLY